MKQEIEKHLILYTTLPLTVFTPTGGIHEHQFLPIYMYSLNACTDIYNESIFPS